MTKLIEYLPKMLIGEELEQAMTFLPKYSIDICCLSASDRLLALESLSEIYVPSMMTYEIYSKIYLAMAHSLDKKNTKLALKQSNQNYRQIHGMNYSGVLGGSDAFSIIGPSGIGKTTAILKSMVLAGGMNTIVTEEPYDIIVPCISVQCPHDCSVKSLMFAILKEIDLAIGTNTFEIATKTRASIDVLITHVSQQLMLHGALLVVDECQNLCSKSKKNTSGEKLISALTQLINNSGVSICLVGLPETMDIFNSEMQLARRNIGLHYKGLDFDDYFVHFCKTLFQYQYVANPCELTDGMLAWIYEHCKGIIAITISLFAEAQQIAIIDRTEKLDIGILSKAYENRMQPIQGFIEHTPIKQPAPCKKASYIQEKPMQNKININIADIVRMAKNTKTDVVPLLKEAGISICEVDV